MLFVRIGLFGLVAAVIIVAIIHPPGSKSGPAVVVVQQPARRVQPRSAAPKTLVVYVAGAVRRPGLYRVTPGSRAFDAVQQAGGLRDDADPAGVDLAEVLFDGEEIAAPILVAHRTAVRRTAAHGIRKPARPKRAPKGAVKAADPAAIDLNTADAQALAALPGIGPQMADALVRFREANGPFASLDELADVAGMTQHRIDAVTPYLYVNQ